MEIDTQPKDKSSTGRRTLLYLLSAGIILALVGGGLPTTPSGTRLTNCRSQKRLSRHPVQGADSVKAGDVLATAVGFRNPPRNVFVDFGVYDLRQKNAASEDPAWAAAHPGDQAQHGICWFDLLSATDEVTVRALPGADSKSGKTSDYCQ